MGLTFSDEYELRIGDAVQKAVSENDVEALPREEFGGEGKDTPLDLFIRNTMNISGISIMIFCCAGSAVEGVIFVCQNIVTPMSTGMT